MGHLQCEYDYGNRNSRLAIVGGTPFAPDVAAAQPFAAGEGRTLNEAMRMTGVSRAGCYLANVARRPAENRKTRNKVLITGTNQRWTAQGLEEYEDFVDRIEDVHPNCWMALGEVPLFALTGKKSITKWRGSILECTIPGHEGEKVIPSLDPGDIFPSMKVEKLLFQSDMNRVAGDRMFPELQLHKHELYIEPSFKDVMDWLDLCDEKGMYSYDIEVLRGLNSQMTCISFGVSEREAMSIPFYDGYADSKCYWDIEDEITIKRRIARLLDNPDHLQIGQNLIFDDTFMCQQDGILATGIKVDSMMMHRTMYPDLKSGLDMLCSLYTRIPYYKDDRKVWEQPERDQNNFWKYNARDSIAPFVVVQELVPDMDLADYTNYARRCQILPSLTYMEMTGLVVDQEEVLRVKAEARARADEAQAALNAIVGAELNVGSAKQMQAYFYGKKEEGGLGITPYLNLKTKRPSLDDLSLQRIIRKHDLEAARLVQAIRAEEKMINTYYEVVVDEDGHLRSSYAPRGTKTGRLSSGESVRGTGTNYQNQPEEFKRMMTSEGKREDGSVHVLAELDKKGAEWVVVAYLSENENMLEIVINGLDAHARTGFLITGVPENVIIAEASALKHTTSVRELANLRNQLFPSLEAVAKVLPRNMTIRQMSKKANHGLNYDLGADAFSIANDIDLKTSRAIVEGYYDAYGTEGYHKWVQAELRKPGKKLRDCFGNEYKFIGDLNPDTFRLAYSYIPQSTVVNMVNRGALEPLMFDERYQMLRLRAQVHDSALTAAWVNPNKPETVHRWCYELAHLGLEDMSPVVEYHGRKFQIGTDCKIGTVWGKMEEIELLPDIDKMVAQVTPILERLHA